MEKISIIKILFWECVARLGFWVPTSKYLPLIWWKDVLISYTEDYTELSYRCHPEIAHYDDNRWVAWNPKLTTFLNTPGCCSVTHWRKLPNLREGYNPSAGKLNSSLTREDLVCE